jgi:surface carbohydrate biosynthesis protein
MSKRSLIIPCETQTRELDAKLLLACFAAERGFSVIVGSKKQINRRMGSLPRSIYLSKSLTKRNALNYEMLRRIGHTLIGGDEEALVYSSPESYLQLKVSELTLRKTDALVAWGPKNARLWGEFAGFHGAPIYITGNPRTDLLRPELRDFFTPDVEAIRRRFGRFVLVNTNFSRVNHYFSGQSRQRRALESGAGSAFTLGLADHKTRLFGCFDEMVVALARAFPDQTIVIRPHPSEQHETWKRTAAGYPNVHVLHEGNVIPWLLASDVLIHNGCTTAIEAYLLGVASIAYQPVRSKEFDHDLPNRMSHRAFDVEALIQLVKDQLGGGIAPDPTEEAAKQELIDRHIVARTGALASERLVDALELYQDERGDGGRPSLASDVAGRVAAKTRGWIQRMEAYIPGHHNNLVFLRHMFPGVDEADVGDRIERFGALLGRFSGVRARRLYDDVFEISAIDAK